MAHTWTMTLELPAGLPAKAEATAREGAVLSLWQEGMISTGRAAKMLGLCYHDFLDLLAERRIPFVQADEPNEAALEKFIRLKAEEEKAENRIQNFQDRTINERRQPCETWCGTACWPCVC
jgi:predicted HTH domain antitoxin